MTIDELCEVIRKRRQRTGLAWELKYGCLRETGESLNCPLTAACLEVHNIEFDADDAQQAADELELEGRYGERVIIAADFDTEDEWFSPALRAKLEAACLGPLE